MAAATNWPPFVQVLGEEEYNNWSEEMESAELSVEHRDSQVFQTTCKIEQKLQLLGGN